MNKEINVEVKDMLVNAMINMREFLLKKKPHIKKYYKWRKVHSEILDSMYSYINTDKYDLTNELYKAENELLKEVNGNERIIEIDLDLRDNLEINLFIELQVYKNHPKMSCITEEYIAKNKFRNKEKLEFLEAMNNSFISFFKIIDKDFDGYVTLVDLVTGKEYKIVDIALSNPMYKNNFYIYSRIFSIDGIHFASTLFAFPKNNKYLNNYINNLKRKHKSNIAKTLEAFDIYKKMGISFITNNI